MNHTMTAADKFYPIANQWMWDYCFFLGKFTDSKGKNHDLGIYINTEEEEDIDKYSLAVVHSNEAGDYNSGRLAPHNNPEFNTEFGIETYRRARILGIVPELHPIG
jgi:hypothetical protein